MDDAAWKRVTTSDGGLSLVLPPDWVVEQPDTGDEDTVLVAAPTTDVDPVVAVTREQVRAASPTKSGAFTPTLSGVHGNRAASDPPANKGGGGAFPGDTLLAQGPRRRFHHYACGSFIQVSPRITS